MRFIYFACYSMWTYLTVPFFLDLGRIPSGRDRAVARAGRDLAAPQGEVPAHIASHSTEQTFYFGNDGLLRRHDYVVEISGHFPAAHYVSDYKGVSGIMVPRKRRVFARQPDNTPALDTVIISIDLSDIRFE